ncbi:MAG: CdaR family protein [Vicinamibacterales bacterium]
MAWKPTRNIGLKLAALALGTLLWLTVTGHQIERRIVVPVSYSNVPQPLGMTGDQIDTVSVHVRGDETQISELREGDLRVVVDLSDAHAGPNVISLRTDEVVARPGVEVLQVDPGTVNVTLEKSGQLSVPVQPAVDGQPATGYFVRGISVVPGSVMVEGPESQLKEPITVTTERVMLEGRTANVVQDVGIGVSNAQLRVRQPRTVRVTVHIERGRAQDR